MDWAQKRRWMIISVLVAAAIAFIAILGFAVFYKTPTCFDTKQNGNEAGVDCGGSCSRVCATQAQAPTVRFARILSHSGRNDLIAYIDNPNADVHANSARATIDLYFQDGHQLQKFAYLPLPAKSSIPLFVPGIANQEIQRVFVSFAPGDVVWTKGSGWEKTQPKAKNISWTEANGGERIMATIQNQTAYPANNVPLMATVFAEDGSVLAASQTVLPILPAQGTAQAIFTWSEPFASAPARVEVVPLLTLPRITAP